MSPFDFIRAIAPAAQASMKSTGIPASFVVAEGALESGWGSSRLAVEGLNLFGVKADKSWHGDVLSINTREFLKDQWVMIPANWRKYRTWLECVQDHAAFLLNNKRYAHALTCKDGESFANAVAAAGYATDPTYAAKVISVMRSHVLSTLDKEQL